MIIDDPYRSQRTEPPAAVKRRRALFVAATAWLAFVVYGSLVPLDYHPMPLQAAWRMFLRTRYLNLGVGERADWVANIVLYMPLAYLFCAALADGVRSPVRRIVTVLTVFAGCAAVAVGVEFTQLFFPPRTVSLNDILAEVVGSALGILAWLVWGRPVAALWDEMERGGLPAIRAAVVLYVLAYLALSMFPYDFLVSAQEFAEKFAGEGYALIATRQTCGTFSMCAQKLLGEVVAVAPLGVLLGMALGRSHPHPFRIAVAGGLLLGLVIEVGQLFIASGVSDGVSVLTRAAGVVAGVLLHRSVDVRSLNAARPFLARALALALPFYVIALLWANAWFSAHWVGAAEARAKLDEIRWLPFYYHYYTSETHALRSLLATLAMYAPVGVGYWLWTLSPRRTRGAGRTLVPALIAAALAVVAEAGKLFVADRHPDPTDVLIAMAAAALGYRFAGLAHRWALQGTPKAPAAVTPAATDGGPPAPLSWASLLLLAGVAIALSTHPLGGARLGAAFALYAAVLWRRTGLALPALLAAAPLLDLSPWSGRILVSEFDVLVAVTLAVWLLRRRDDHPSVLPPRGAVLAVCLLAVSFVASAAAGLFPLARFDANALGTYYTGYNALRELKGFGWALALLPLIALESRDPGRMERRFSAGMIAGLCAVVAVVVWQRAVFAGVFDFAVVYRVEGPFPELHTGGGDVHAYLALAIPFVASWIVLRPGGVRAAAGATLFALATYAMGVTFTRGGYVGYAGVLGVLAAAAILRWLPSDALRLRRAVVTAALALGGAAILVPIATGSFMEARIAGASAEAATRAEHWAKAIDEMDSGASTALFGMGLGTFPRTALFRDPQAASATFSFGRERGNGFVRLGSGRPLYLDQRVPVSPGKRYALALDARSAQAGAGIDVFLCEKSIQYSFRCVKQRIAVERGGGWEHHELTLESGELGSGPWLLRRPVAFSIANAQSGSVVDVDNVRLADETGANLVVNGDFSEGSARWLFSADDHLPWHIFNLWVQILFEQGWLGVLAVGLAVAIAVARLAAATWRGDSFAAALLAALVGFLLIGLTESLFDGPRVTTLFFLIVFAALWRTAPRRATGRAARARVALSGATDRGRD